MLRVWKQGSPNSPRSHNANVVSDSRRIHISVQLSVNQPDPSKNLLRRILEALITVPVALWIFLEEWLWDSMLVFMAWLAQLPPVRWLESQIAQLPPYAALFAFLIPAAILLPFKLAAFWLIAHGQSLFGAIIFIIAKIIGTAFLARIFSLTKNALMTIKWFAKINFTVTAWKEWLYAYVRALPVYQHIRVWMHATKLRVKMWWHDLFGG